MSPKKTGHLRKHQIPMTTLRVQNNSLAANDLWLLDIARENRHQLVWWNHFELLKRAGLGFLVDPPSAELGHVSKSIALHVFIGDLNYELGSQRFPRKIFPLAPAALSPGHSGFSAAPIGAVRR
jgi:hypothetical protein